MENKQQTHTSEARGSTTQSIKAHKEYTMVRKERLEITHDQGRGNQKNQKVIARLEQHRNPLIKEATITMNT